MRHSLLKENVFTEITFDIYWEIETEHFWGFGPGDRQCGPLRSEDISSLKTCSIQSGCTYYTTVCPRYWIGGQYSIFCNNVHPVQGPGDT